MRHEVDQGIRDADVTVLVVDAGFEPSLAHARKFEPPPECRALLCLNKWDRVAGEAGRRIAAGFRREERFEVVIPTCAIRGDGVAELLDAVLERLPESPPLYPPEDIAAEPVRFIVAELVRETCFEELAQELPYSVAVAIEQFREGADPVYVECVVFVERESQKGIVIGKGGSMIRRIGTRSRRKIEALVDRPVYLDLRVKVLANWRKNPSRLKLLGYPVPPRRD
jgi:GTP-binding protein Era